MSPTPANVMDVLVTGMGLNWVDDGGLNWVDDSGRGASQPVREFPIDP
jgi:hypothetical protein